VHAGGILEALRRVYGMDALVEELTPAARAGGAEGKAVPAGLRFRYNRRRRRRPRQPGAGRAARQTRDEDPASPAGRRRSGRRRSARPTARMVRPPKRSSLPRMHAILRLTACCACCWPRPRRRRGRPFEPRRALTDAERLEYSVTESEPWASAPCAAPWTRVPPPGGGRPVPYRYVVFEPEQWLKGGLPLAAWPSASATPPRRLRRGPAARRGDSRACSSSCAAPGAPAAPPAAAGPATPQRRPRPAGRAAACEWIVDESPYLYGGG